MSYTKKDFVDEAKTISEESYEAHAGDGDRLGRFHLGVRILLDKYDLDGKEIAEQVLNDNTDQGIDFFFSVPGVSPVIYVIQVKDNAILDHSEQVAACRKMFGEIHYLLDQKKKGPKWTERRKERFSDLKKLEEEVFDIKYVLLLTGDASASDPTDELIADLDPRESIEVVDRTKLAEIEQLNRSPLKPKVVLRLEEGRWFELQDDDSIRTLVTHANAHDYVEATQSNGAQIFRLNPRLYLGETTAKNKGMMATLEDDKERERFHLFNNGITVVCDKYSVSENEIVVEDFQVVNGCQTTETLWRFCKDNAEKVMEFYVPLRIIETKGDEDLASRISERTNAQSAVVSSDFVANDLCQKRIKNGLETALIPVFYTARRGDDKKLNKNKVEKNRFKIDPKDWGVTTSQAHRIIGLKELAQVLLAVTQSPSKAKEQISSLFGDRTSDSLYNKLFVGSWTDIDQIRLVIETYLYISAPNNWCPKEKSQDETKLLGDLARLGRFYVTYLVYRQWRVDNAQAYDPDHDEPLLLPTEVSRRILNNLKSEIGTRPSVAVRSLAAVKKEADVDIRALLRQKTHREDIEKKFDMMRQILDDIESQNGGDDQA